MVLVANSHSAIVRTTVVAPARGHAGHIVVCRDEETVRYLTSTDYASSGLPLLVDNLR